MKGNTEMQITWKKGQAGIFNEINKLQKEVDKQGDQAYRVIISRAAASLDFLDNKIISVGIDLIKGILCSLYLCYFILLYLFCFMFFNLHMQ